MKNPPRSGNLHTHLSPRESQIMDVIYRLGEASVAEVHDYLEDPPGYNSVRVTMRILEEKGHLRHRRDGRRYLYAPTTPRDRAVRGALGHLVETFFHGSAPRAVATLVDMSAEDLGDEELASLAATIERERQRRGESS